MQRQTLWWFTAVSLATLALGACDDSKCKCGASAANRPNVSGDKSVAEVDQAEVREMCRWMQTQLADVDISEAQTCTANSIGTTTSSSECEAKVDSCLAKPAPTPSEDPAESCEQAEKPDFPAGCAKVTVSDYTTCLLDLKAEMEEYINGLSCAENAGQQVKLPSVASCEKLRTNCPPIVPPPLR